MSACPPNDLLGLAALSILFVYIQRHIQNAHLVAARMSNDPGPGAGNGPERRGYCRTRPLGCFLFAPVGGPAPHRLEVCCGTAMCAKVWHPAVPRASDDDNDEGS
jgi:hypothetical protein